MKYFFTLICLVGFVSLAHALNSDKDFDQAKINQVVSKINQALQEQEGSCLQDFLAPNFSVSTFSYPSSTRMLNFILSNDETKNNLLLKSASPSKSTKYFADLEVVFSGDGQETEGIIVLDSAYKIHHIDYFDALYGRFRYQESSLVAELPFHILNNSIVFDIRLNNSDRILKFLFDSGADGMAISRALADSIGIVGGSQQEAKVVGGSSQVSISRENTVHIGDFKLENMSMAIFPTMGDKAVDGIIGIALAMRYITKIDFDTQTMSLYNFGNYEYQEAGEIIDVTTPHGVVILPGSINVVGKKEVLGNYVFDTGANYHFIGFESYVRKNRLLLTGFVPLEQASTVSLGHSTPVFRGKCKQFSIAKKIYFSDLPITLQASSSSKNAESERPDGSIGILLLNQYNLTLNLLNQEILFSPRK